MAARTTMSEKPTAEQLALPLGPPGTVRCDVRRLGEHRARERIRYMYVAGYSVAEIATRTGAHPRYIEAVLHKPSRIVRGYT